MNFDRRLALRKIARKKQLAEKELAEKQPAEQKEDSESVAVPIKWVSKTFTVPGGVPVIIDLSLPAPTFEIHTHVPEQKPPDVRVTVEVPPQDQGEVTVERDGQGYIKRLIRGKK